MSLRDELAPPSAGGRTCSILGWIAEQGDRAPEWIELLNDASVQTKQLYGLMVNYGWKFGESPIGNHRRGGCRCGRPAY